MADALNPIRILAACGAALALLGACSGPADAPDPARVIAAPAQSSPTPAERRAARLLSLANNSSLDAKSDPYARAVACVVAIDSVQQRLSQAIGMSAEQKRAIVMARQIYERKAAAAQPDAAVLSADLEKARSEAEDPNELARMGVSCLRQLA